MPASPVLWNLDERGVATVTLNRPEVNNAYDAGLINGVLAAMDELGKQPCFASWCSGATASIFRPAPT